MENKKTGIIIASIAIILFAIVAFIFLYKPARDAVIHNNEEIVEQTEEITGDLPELDCKYDNDEESFNDAVIEKNINSCECIKNEAFKKTCKTTAMNVSFYDRALAQLDDSFCDKIVDEIQKDACYAVVKSSIEQFEQKDQQYLADTYAKTHNEKAIQEYEALIENGNEDIDNYINLALSYAEKGLKEQERGNDQTPYINKAFEAIENAKKIDDKNSEVYRVEGYINEIKPDLMTAIDMYDKAIELDPKNIMAYIGRGHTNRMKSTTVLAIEDFKKADELDPENTISSIYSNLCTLEYSRSEYEDAIINCKKTIAIENVDVVFQSDALKILSLIFKNKNDIDQAYNYALQAKTLTPNDANIYVLMSELNLYQKRYENAELNAKKAIEISPEKATAYLALARALYMQEKFDEAIAAAENGITFVKNDVTLLVTDKPATERDLNFIIANSYRQIGNTQKEEEYKKRGEKAFNNLGKYLN